MAQDPVTVTWYVGVGTGGDPAQREAQEEVVQRFNDSRDDIQINLIIVENNVAVDTLATLIATGEGPDIVGPAGFAGANAFRGNWLGIDELVEADGYDMSQFPEAAVNVQRDDQGALLGLPLANFPTVIYYRPALFEEAGLEMLPENYGDMYMLDGEEVEWNVETLTEVAKILTVDENGNDATMEEFDPATTIQWGFTNQWSGNLRQHGTMFGAGSLYEVDADGNYVAVFPEQWREALKWEYAGIWEGQYIPDASEDGSDLLAAGNAFSSGNLAMAQSHLWYTCCLSDDEWELAPIPSALGQTTARLHADTFRILNTTENPEAAFEVLKYLTGEASLDLLAVYGGMPARPDDQPAFFEGMMEKFPSVTNWQVVGQSLEYTDVPSHEEWLPNNNKTNDRIDALWSLLSSTPDLDVDAEIDTLVSDLQAIYDEAAES
jgi:multiple sugar transport system substrate-binding protein